MHPGRADCDRPALRSLSATGRCTKHPLPRQSEDVRWIYLQWRSKLRASRSATSSLRSALLEGRPYARDRTLFAHFLASDSELAEAVNHFAHQGREPGVGDNKISIDSV